MSSLSAEARKLLDKWVKEYSITGFGWKERNKRLAIPVPYAQKYFGDMESFAEFALVAVKKTREERFEDGKHIGFVGGQNDVIFTREFYKKKIEEVKVRIRRETAKENLKIVMDYFDERITFWNKRIQEEKDGTVFMNCIFEKTQYEVDKEAILKLLSNRGQSDEKKVSK